MRFIYRTLAILALAMAAGMTHSWFVPIATSFGDPDEARGAGVQEGEGSDQGSETSSETGPEPPDPRGGDGADPEPDPEPDTGDAGGGEAGAEPEPDPVEPGPDPTETPAQPPQETVDIDALGDYIGVEEARAIWRAGNEDFTRFIAFLDARYPDPYAEGHITGARRLLAHEFTDGTGMATVNWLLEQEPDLVVIYCEGGECDASRNLARQLERNTGITREQLHVLQPGYPAWAEKYPDLTTTGDQPGEP